jgi:autotransporter-associated beta strand protein
MNTKHLLQLPVVALAALLCGSTSGLAQSVLLTASEFALLGGTAISVGGPGPNPIVNGHVGLSPAATTNITGFPPSVVSGITLAGDPAAIIATGGQTLQAQNDLITARNALFAMPQIPANDLSNLNLGTLAALQPGVYFSTSATNQTGDIVLDANFQNSVAWVFNFSLSLTTAANSNVTFINLGTNGGSDNGLYWNAATAINIGDNNTIAGNYLAGTAISFTGITATLGGGGSRALAGSAVSFAGPGSVNALGGPGGGDYDGGLTYNGLGQLIPWAPAVVVPPVIPPVVPPVVVVPPIVIPPAVVPPAAVVPPIVLPPAAVYTGNVLLSATGLYTKGSSDVILTPGVPYPVTTMTVDGSSRDGAAPASFTVTTATVTLSGPSNTYTGGTFLNGAILTGSTANLPVNGGVTMTNGSAFVLDQAVDASFGGAITGAGSFSKTGASALTLTGANTYTGVTTVGGGSLVASSTSLPTNGAISVASGSTLVFNQAADGSFGGNITGSGTVQKSGAAMLTVTGTSSSTVSHQTGWLINNGTMGSTTVASGAFLGGNGTISGNLTNNGTVSPGNSPGTITVSGNYVQPAGGKLVIELASATSFDLLAVGGTASLAGSLQIDALAGYNPVGKTFTFLTAPGGVSGTFGTLSGNALVTNSAAVHSAIVYAPTSVSLTYVQLPFAGFALTPNQIATAKAAQNDPAITAALNVVPTAGQFPAALNALSPQDYQVWSDFAFAHGTALSDRLLQSGRMPTGCDDYYFEGGQRRGRARGDLDLNSSAYTASTGLVGGNKALNAHTAVGAFLGFGKTTAGLGSGGISQTTVKNKTLGVRAAVTHGNMWAEAMLAYGMDTYSSTRVISFPGTAAVAKSFTRGHQWITGVTVGQDHKAGSLTVSPFAGLLASRWKANSFSETGAGAFNATLGNQRAHSLRAQLGAEARYTLGRLQPHVRAAWLHEFSHGSRSMPTSFGPTNNYAVATRTAPRNVALYSGGLDFLIAPNALLYTEFTAQGGGSTKVLKEWRAGLSVSF